MKAVFSRFRRGAAPTIFAALALTACSGALSAQAADATSPASTNAAAGDKWRFVWHNNQWWYYQADGSWKVHDGNAWQLPSAAAPVAAQVYRAPTYQAPAARYQQQPRYRQYMSSQRSGGGMDNDGFWGNPTRYWTYQHVLK
jgi:hypothetical protein